jgi:nucleoside-diphosphate kinase
MEKTLIIVKPHAVDRGLVGVFLNRFENIGLRIAELKVLREPRELWEKFYPSDEQWLSNVGKKTLENYKKYCVDIESKLGTSDPVSIGKIVKDWLVDHMSSGNSIAVILEGNEAINKVRLACGNTLPNLAAPGTIRFDFSCDSPILANAEKRPIFNLIHASDPEEMRGGKKAVDYEISVLFPRLMNRDNS